MEQGRYNLGNDNFINTINSIDENKHITGHEEVHKYLCSKSTYGLLLIILQKNRILDFEHKWLLEYLEELMFRMQERIATFVEYLNIYISEGEEAYNKKLNELKENTKYFNYLRTLLHSKLDWNDSITAETVRQTLLGIGVISLNIDLDKIPFESFEDRKDVQRYLNKDENNKLLLPNRRFEILFNYVYRDSKEYESDALKILANTLILDDNNQINQCVQNAASRLYKGNPNYSRLMTRAQTIRPAEYINETNVDSSLLSALPVDMNFKEDSKFKYDLMDLEKLKKRYLKDKNKNVVIRLEHPMAGLEDVPFITLWYLDDQKMYTSLYNPTAFEELVPTFDVPIIFCQNKLFRMKKNRIRGLARQLPVYLYMEKSIGSSLDFIIKNFNRGKYFVVEEDKNLALAFSRGSYVLIQPIINALVEELDTLLGPYNITEHASPEDDFDMKLISKIVCESSKFSKHAINFLDQTV